MRFKLTIDAFENIQYKMASWLPALFGRKQRKQRRTDGDASPASGADWEVLSETLSDDSDWEEVSDDEFQDADREDRSPRATLDRLANHTQCTRVARSVSAIALSSFAAYFLAVVCVICQELYSLAVTDSGAALCGTVALVEGESVRDHGVLPQSATERCSVLSMASALSSSGEKCDATRGRFVTSKQVPDAPNVRCDHVPVQFLRRCVPYAFLSEVFCTALVVSKRSFSFNTL